MDRLPLWGAVTGVGSLPHTDPEAAVAFVARHAPVVPFWPQLPRRGPQEGMLAQLLAVETRATGSGGGLGGLRVPHGDPFRLEAAIRATDPRPDAERCAGWAPFVAAVTGGAFPDSVLLKGQLTGPVTLAANLHVGGTTAATLPPLMDAVVDLVARSAAAQATALAGLGRRALVVVDEPSLGAVDADRAVDAVGAVLTAIRDAEGVAGVHTCALGGTAIPPGLDADLLSLDLHGRRGALPSTAAAAWADDTALAAGLVPTGDAVPPPVDATAELWERAAQASGGAPAVLLGRTLLTATCGLAGTDLARATASFRHAGAVGALLRHRHAPRDVGGGVGG